MFSRLTEALIQCDSQWNAVQIHVINEQVGGVPPAPEGLQVDCGHGGLNSGPGVDSLTTTLFCPHPYFLYSK